MDIEDQFSLEHLLFNERKCRVCGETKDLVSDFYLIRKNKRSLPSSYSYECKQCAINRVIKSRKGDQESSKINYPDW